MRKPPENTPLRIEAHVHVHHDPADTSVHQQVSHLVTLVTQLGATMSAQLDALTAEVSRVRDVDASVVALITGLAAQIAAAKDDPVAIQALADDLKDQTDALAAAVTAQTS